MSKADIKTRKPVNIKYPDRFKIVILNDDYTPFDFVLMEFHMEIPLWDFFIIISSEHWFFDTDLTKLIDPWRREFLIPGVMIFLLILDD